MANPRQRRKLRSGSSTKPSNKAKREASKRLVRVPLIKGAKVIQDAWDKKLTVRQNYQKLGLIGNLSMRDSGGKEKDYALHNASLPESINKNKGMAKVIRDEEGNIVSVEETEKPITETAWGPALNEDDDDEGLVTINVEEDGTSKSPTEVTQTLEMLSKTVKPVPRFTSQAEKSWLHKLAAKHGSDTAAMARDDVDNICQRTEGEIKRAMKKAGGLDALLE